MAEKTGQNSFFRKFTGPVTDGLARSLKKTIPGITADDITQAGFWGVALGAALAVIPKELTPGVNTTPIALAFMAGGTSLDALDGAMARVLGTTSINGALLDTLVDRKQESVLALSRIVSASLRKDSFGVMVATLAGVTNPLPSFLRSKVEKKGYFVPESGAKWVSFFGTRPMRALFGILGTAIPETHFPGLENPTLQPALDTLSALSNIFTTFERANILAQANNGQLKTNPDEAAQQLGILKSKELSKYIAVNTALMIVVGTIGLFNTFQQ